VNKEGLITAKELVNTSPNIIRRDNELMRSYIQFYKDAFSISPNCASCTFMTDFNKLKNYILTSGVKLSAPHKYRVMNHTLKQKHRNEILTYRVGNKPFRSYGNLATDEFFTNFLKEGTKEQRKERAKMFEAKAKEVKKPTGESTKPETEIAAYQLKDGIVEPVEAVNTEAEVAAVSFKYSTEDLRGLNREALDSLLTENGLRPDAYTNIKGARKALLTL
jgi:hypothetical protein